MDYQSKSKEELINDLVEMQQKHNATIELFKAEIAEQKQLTKNLEKEKTLLQVIINETTDAIYVKDTNGKYLLFNHAAEQFTGKKAKDVLNKDDSYLFSVEEAKVIMDGDKRIIEEGIIKTYEEFVTSADSRKIIFLSTKGPILSKNGNPFGLFGIARDITERKQVEESLRKSEDLFNKAFHSSPSPMTITRRMNGEYIAVNDSFLSLVGQSREDVIGKKSLELGLINASSWDTLLKTVQETGHIHNVEIIANSKSGKPLYLLTSIENTEIAGIECTIATMLDITEQKQIANALRLSEDKFRKAFFTNPDAITITRLTDGRYISANKGFTQIFGYNEEEILEKTSRDINIWHNYNDRKVFIDTLQTKGVIENFETKFNTKEGKVINALIFSTIIELEDIPHSLTITRDITKQKSAEHDLNQSRDLLLNLAQLVPGVIYQYRLYPDGRSAFPYSSPGMFTIYEVTPEEVQYDATPVFSRLHPDDFDNVVKLITESAETLNTFYCEFRVILPAQGLRWRWSQAHPIRMDDGSILWHGIISDITERKEAEIQLQEKTEQIEAQNEEYCQINEELHQANQELSLAKLKIEESEERMRFSLEGANDGIWDVNMLTNAVYISPRGCEILGYSPNEMSEIAKVWSDLVYPDDLKHTNDILQQYLSGDKPIFEIEQRLRTKSGKWKWVLTRGKATVKDKLGQPLRMTGTHTDISNRKKDELIKIQNQQLLKQQNEEYLLLNEELNRKNEEFIVLNENLKIAKQKAEQSDHLKTAFLQNMSHEIRTPMNAIMGFSDLLVKQYNNKAKLERFSQIINQRCADLLDIINEVLDVAKIESGQLPIYIEECKLVPLFSEISSFFNEFQKRQEKQHLNFNVQIDCGSYGTVIYTDKVKLKQILINLIGNAFKYTDHGEIQTGCKLDNNQQLLFYVSDTGVGIPDDKQDFIFERFAQLEPTPGRLYGGTGLGLSIVKGLIDLLGGKIWLDSIPEKGTTFYFNLPYETANYLLHEPTLNEERGEFDFSGKTILIVEDDQYNASYIKEVLDGTGIEIIHSLYGNEAIQISKSEKLDVILMDIRLPDIDGYTATKMIRKSNPDLKIIAQTAYAATEDKERAINSGCNDYIKKPVGKDALLSLINKHLLKK